MKDRFRSLLSKSATVEPAAGLFDDLVASLNSCPELYFVTLTTRRQVDKIGLSREVARLLAQVNKRLFGTAYSRRAEVSLVSFAVQEETINQGLHEHLVLGVPAGAADLKAHRCPKALPDLIVSAWCGLDQRGRRSPDAQDVRRVTDLSGVLAYVCKTGRSNSEIEFIDVLNTHIPTSCPGDARAKS